VIPFGIAPVVAIGAVALVILAGLAFAFRGDSARSASRSSTKASRRGIEIAGIGLVSILGAIVGAADAGADVLGETVAIVAQYPGMLTQLSLAGIGTWVASTSSSLPATTFAAIAGFIILVGVAVGRS